MEKIIKRDGSVVPFNLTKVTEAIAKAGRATGQFGMYEAYALSGMVLSQLEHYYEDGRDTTCVEDVQDIVEQVLCKSEFFKSAKAYIIYRSQRSQLRALQQRTSTDLVNSYLDKMDWRVKENSNQGFSLQGLNNFLSSNLTSTYWLNVIYSDEIRKAHESGDLHIHDLNLLSAYCVGWDLMDLLKEGFKGVGGNIESSPAKHFSAALGQLVNFFYTLQGEAAGAQAVSSFDTLLAPFIRHDNLSFEEVKQHIQSFLFNINVPTRVGFQTPFTNVTLDLQVPEHYKNVPVIIGGEPQVTVYGDYQEEVYMFNRAFAEVMMKGDNKGRVFTFPIPTYNITKDFDWDDDRLDPIWRMTGKYGIPYFSNFVNSDMDPSDARSMCCRLRLDNRELRRRGGGLFGANPLTGSIGVVTLNMARIGYTCDTEDKFLARVGYLMDLAKESLCSKRKVLEQYTDGGLYPYVKFYLRDIKLRTEKFWSNHFSTIGLCGMNEALVNFMGKSISSAEGRAMALRIQEFMRKRLQEYQDETGDVFNLEATPAEGTAYRFALLDRAKFPDMIGAGNRVHSETEYPYYTNSTQLPVMETEDVFKALELQDALQCSYTGGTVFHMFVGEEIKDPQVVKEIVRMVTKNFKLPYFTITPTFSVCPTHGYISGEHAVCEKCGKQTEVYSRVVGYLRPTSRWNDGKQSEFMDRKTFRVN